MGAGTGTSLIPVTGDSTGSRTSRTQAAAEQGQPGQGSWVAGTGRRTGSHCTATSAQAPMKDTVQVLAVRGSKVGGGGWKAPSGRNSSWEQQSQTSRHFKRRILWVYNMFVSVSVSKVRSPEAIGPPTKMSHWDWPLTTLSLGSNTRPSRLAWSPGSELSSQFRYNQAPKQVHWGR